MTTKSPSNIHRLFSNIKLPWLLFTLLVFIALVKLGFWQLDRAQQKIQRLERIEKLKHQQALSITQVINLAQNAYKNKSNTKADLTNQVMTKAQAETINDLPVKITAKFDDKHIFLLDNQVENNALGYRVFQVAHSQSHYFLVNLGWVIGSINRQLLPQFTPVSGLQTFTGHIRKMERGVVLQEQIFDKISWPLRLQQIEPNKLSPLIGEKLLPFVVYLDKNEEIGFIKNWHPVVMPPAKHQAYAFQWFSLALAWLILMIWITLKSNDNANIKVKTTNNNNKAA
ncbi:MAG: SURF1 family protein [Alteromonadaceae bacterium]|nr:SURF1 family protein [Alteromonadaceae bacterium]